MDNLIGGTQMVMVKEQHDLIPKILLLLNLILEILEEQHIQGKLLMVV